MKPDPATPVAEVATSSVNVFACFYGLIGCFSTKEQRGKKSLPQLTQGHAKPSSSTGAIGQWQDAGYASQLQESNRERKKWE